MKATVDVAINVFGKVNQTALTLLSLLEHCGEHIDRIYFQEEPLTAEYEFKSQEKILEYLKDKIVHYVPAYWNGIDPTDMDRVRSSEEYRLSVRYQYGWEKCQSRYLLIIHNDMEVKADVVGNLLRNIKDHTGIGEIGQCARCPARQYDLCDPTRFMSFRPSYQYLMRIYNKDIDYVKRRAYNLGLSKQFQDNAWPLPECRLNEWCALIDMEKARASCIPVGKAAPFGARIPSGACIGENWDRPVCLDVAVQWFRDMLHMGHTFAHYNVNQDIIHDKCGNVKLDSTEAYVKAEVKARKRLQERFPDFYAFANS